MKLYDYWRSGAAYRVRIAFRIKGVPYEHVGVHLSRDGGAHHKPAYRAVNPQERVPALALDDGSVVVQSSAILEWLEETYPNPPLLPADKILRARVRGIAAIVGADIHPLTNAGNSGPGSYLKRTFGADDAAVRTWTAHWTTAGFRAVETLIEAAPCCVGNTPTLADVYLVPQVVSARRFQVPLDAFPKIVRAAEYCLSLEPFRRAAPEAQPDAE
ncbi:MAG: maleylacetoacetate isomerase [Hyphomicrobiaceae bacterium]